MNMMNFLFHILGNSGGCGGWCGCWGGTRPMAPGGTATAPGGPTGPGGPPGGPGGGAATCHHTIIEHDNTSPDLMQNTKKKSY